MKKNTQSELKNCKKELRQARKRIDELEMELSKYKPQDGTAPHNINGWNVQHSGGYFRLFKRVNNKLHGIYLGKKCDEDLARKKIRKKMKDLKLAQQTTKKGGAYGCKN